MSSATAGPDDGLSAFLSLRPRLFGIAYRMLGSAAEAEDIVQDVWVRWQTADRSVVRDAAAFLATTDDAIGDQRHPVGPRRAARRTLDRGCRNQSIPAPTLGWERNEARRWRYGVRLLLDNLTPTERAAYILREAFDYPYRDIANVLRLQEANARQVVTRARKHVASGGRVTTPRRLRSVSRRSGPLQIRHTLQPRLEERL